MVPLPDMMLSTGTAFAVPCLLKVGGRNKMTIQRLEYRSTDVCLIGYIDKYVFAKIGDDTVPFLMSISGYDTVVKGITTAVNKSKHLDVTDIIAGKRIDELTPMGKWNNTTSKLDDNLVHSVLLHESVWSLTAELPVVLAWDGDLTEALYTILEDRFTVPLLKEWTPWIQAQLEVGDHLFELGVVGDPVLKAARLNLKEEDLANIVSIGLQKGFLIIPDAATVPDTDNKLSRVDNVSDYLKEFAPDHAKRITETYAPVHNPEIDGYDPMLDSLKRKLFPAQAHVATGLAKKLKDLNAVLNCGEMGTGKTSIGAAVPYILTKGKPYRALVMCPGHLVEKWAREIHEIVPGATATIIHDWRQLVNMYQDMPRKPQQIEYHIISKDRAKLSYFVETRARWNEHRKAWFCPECGQEIELPLKTNDDGKPLTDEEYYEMAKKHFEEYTATNYLCRNQVKAWDADAKEYRFKPCNAKLWGASDKLRRFAPADFIKRYMKGYYHTFICDEVHEMKGDTGQGNVFGMLAGACKKTLALTGTLLGGYAADLFYILFRMSPETMKAEGLSYSSLGTWESLYGIVEKRIHHKTEEEIRKTTKGKSKKTVSTYRRPGVSPVVFSRHLLEKVAFLELQDLAEHLPGYKETVELVSMDYGLEVAYKELAEKIAEHMKANRYTRGARGAIGSQVNTLMAYPDNPYNWEPIKVKKTGVVVAEPRNLDPNILWPKEERLLELIRKEKAEGRRVYVYANYTGTKNDVTERLYKVISEAGFSVAVLKRSVKPEKREQWLANRCKQGIDVVISNAKLVETGLDLTGRTNFPTLIWYQTGYNLFTLRQASRRSWRIGQKMDVRVYFLAYEGTLQSDCLALMGSKLEASMTLEGKFSEEGLRALAETTDMTTALAKALVDGMGEVDSAEAIWGRMGYSKMEEVFADLDTAEEEVISVPETVVKTVATVPKIPATDSVKVVTATTPMLPVTESKVKVKSSVKIVELKVVPKKSKSADPVSQLGWDFNSITA